MLSYLLITGLVLLLVAVIWFASPKLSPIPYFPTPDSDLNRIKQALGLKAGSVLYDLGAGNGKIVFQMANRQIKTVAVENNPFLVLIIQLRRLFHPFKPQIKILWQDLLKTDLTQATHVYLFVGPFLIDKIVQIIEAKPHPRLQRIVCYRYGPKDKRFKKFSSRQWPIFYRNLKQPVQVFNRNQQ